MISERCLAPTGTIRSTRFDAGRDSGGPIRRSRTGGRRTSPRQLRLASLGTRDSGRGSRPSWPKRTSTRSGGSPAPRSAPTSAATTPRGHASRPPPPGCAARSAASGPPAPWRSAGRSTQPAARPAVRFTPRTNGGLAPLLGDRGVNLRHLRLLRGVRPDAYLMVAAGQRLYAPSLEELAEIAECAREADDPIELLRARGEGGCRPLSGRECERFLRALRPPR
jgi:hypothetical protein